jgi:hypothetical protein
MTLRPVGAERFHADRQTNVRDYANSLFSKFWESAYNFQQAVLQIYTGIVSKTHISAFTDP